MSFWDQPGNWPVDSWPSQPGGTVEGTVTRMAVRLGRYGKLALCVELDGDGRERWCSTGLWRALGAERVDVGHRVRVTRHEDPTGRPTASGQPAVRWHVEPITTTTPAPAAAAAPTGPQW